MLHCCRDSCLPKSMRIIPCLYFYLHNLVETMTTSSEFLRAALNDLESQTQIAGAALIRAESDHRTALVKSVNSGVYTLSIPTEAAITTARATYDRLNASREVARDLLTQAVRREKAEVQATARAEIESELADLAEVAHTLDTQFAALVGQLVRLQERETSLHRKTRDHFRSPWTAPQALTAARSLSTILSTLANGGTPKARPVIADTVASAAHAIKAAFDA